MSHPNLDFDVYGNSDIVQNKKTICITFGNFDGVHLGHKYLIEYMKSKSNNSPLVVITFNPHSADFFNPNNPKPLLTNLEDKVSLLLTYGVDAVVVQKFNEKFASLSADEFCDKWLLAFFNIQYVILGHDFCYGKNRQGNFLHMKNYGEKHGWKVSQIPALDTQSNEPISSSLIRKEIALGNMINAEKLLGRAYTLSGVVTRGDQRGRTIGFPTANLKLSCNYAIPKYGVYACYVKIDDDNSCSTNLLPSVMNCGIRPSVGDGLKLQIEAHIFDFNKDIYDKKIQFHIKNFIRGEMKFSSLEELKKQITSDVLKSRELLDQCF